MKGIFSAALIGGLVVGGLAMAAPASAEYDYAGYINALEDAGLMGEIESGGFGAESAAIWTGMFVCRSLGEGQSRDAIVYSLANGEGMLLDNVGASAVYYAATTYLC